MSWKDLADFPQDIPNIPAMGTPDEIDEMWYNAEHSYPVITIKPFTGKNEPPLRPMQRQHLPLGHPDRIPYEERMYQFFRNYRIDVERGRIACSNEEYRSVLVHEDYYKSLWLGTTQTSKDWFEDEPIDEATRKAIAEDWEAHHKDPSKGYITEEELKMLRSADMPPSGFNAEAIAKSWVLI